MAEAYPGGPTCCPDAYLCLTGRAGMECPRHSASSVCCSRPDRHITQASGVWHRQMARWERSLLDAHTRSLMTPPPHPLRQGPPP
jgi:ureidoglycolate hydrolase